MSKYYYYINDKKFSNDNIQDCIKALMANHRIYEGFSFEFVGEILIDIQFDGLSKVIFPGYGYIGTIYGPGNDPDV